MQRPFRFQPYGKNSLFVSMVFPLALSIKVFQLVSSIRIGKECLVKTTSGYTIFTAYA